MLEELPALGDSVCFSRTGAAVATDQETVGRVARVTSTWLAGDFGIHPGLVCCSMYTQIKQP